jgi:hypothetical protein
VGANGSILVANSTATTGLSWQEENVFNPVINGGYDVWQRGTVSSVSANVLTQYVADRWQPYRAVTGATINRVASGLTGFDSIKLETVPSIRTGEFVPQVQASRPLPYNLRGTLWSEVAGDRANGARVEYRLYDDISVFAGWRSQSVLEPSSANTSNLISGFSFRNTFKGLSFFENRIKRSD